MNIKQLEKTQKIFNRITELDKEIIEVERCASLLCNESFDMEISFKRKFIKPKEDSKNSFIFYFKTFEESDESEEWKKKKEEMNTDALNITLNASVSDSLAILEAMLRIKQFERLSLLKQLKSFGIEIV